MYKNWYEKQARIHPDEEYINASEGGVHVEGFEDMPLASAFEDVPEHAIDFTPYFRDAALAGGEREAIARDILDGFEGIRDDIRSMQAVCVKALHATDALAHAIRSGGNTQALLDELNAHDTAIAAYEQAKAFVGITMQKAISRITAGVAVEEDVEEGMEPVVNSRYLYKELNAASDFNLRIIEMASRKLRRELS
jgi:hypothetical protein